MEENTTAALKRQITTLKGDNEKISDLLCRMITAHYELVHVCDILYGSLVEEHKI